MNPPAKPPNRLPWPPIIYGLAIAVAWGLGQYVPVRDANWPIAVRGLGGVAIIIGLVIDIGAMFALYKAKTTILPHRAASRLVTRWPFSMSRNPIYLGNALFLFGLSGVLSSLWLTLTTLISLLLVSRLAIRREEVHLQELFGAEWEAYRLKTPRWVWKF
ncbi:isoprenylcysteine carboxylmethyltransferase family protein [Asticcacaulis sp. AND118]|uniref:methyltransferase family protein n=1 Tax=Asticcacaulis sp. AND118 TaxID=2840468 RepID=UPI001CFF6EA4|nr:isoprenylcysteine carboxylmethyltransferase family protein [Asticcacaulis sp. AND118]UDF05783.1 isoprenylcysteine carboxylmethyltransferase family protein [Asticcacaulis sp. AND118]